ncbi:restriction endonuclease subunit S [Vibrio sp. YMD68]|uniref:restriction endonuclease subunit S n=1 Tax=Vibrio sp. YMD68 TaxID=3042300 RepID=UPI00249C5431|nr:restriction endonuclease subunit S [Vibrio sp. YMD68]WGW00169.1 restriction endonuclease subunit S [Vibrio sp. YMD68]
MSFELHIPEGWSQVKLSDLGEVNRGRSRHRPRDAAHLYGGPYPFVQTGDVKASKGRVTQHSQTYSEEGLAQSRLWPKGTMCITIAANIAETGILTYPACFPDSVIGFIADESKCNVYFIEYVFRLLRKRIQAQATGSVQDNINLQTLERLLFPIPALEEQNRIAAVLGELDDKIHLNYEINQTLEHMAQAIFKSWFVDFEPVKAKMNGEQTEGMDAATASLFPEKLDSETGIPVGWSQGIIADIAKLNAKSWTKKNQPEQVHYVDLANTKNGVIETVTTFDFDEAPSRARRVLNSGDTIVGTVRPGNRSFAFIGETEQPLTGSTGFAVLSPKEEFWTSFVYLATTNDDTIDEYARLADGGAYPAIKPVVVADTPCVIPTTDIAQKFWQLTGSMLKKAHQNRLENEELAKLRDTLLPKLLSGEIDLDKAQNDT